MAVITIYGLVNPLHRRQASPGEVPGLDVSIEDHTLPGYPRLMGLPQPGTPVNNTPIELEPKVSMGGYRQPTFLDDYYHRIHIRPSTIELGNLLSAQVREVEVWNSHFVPKLLSQIRGVGTDGITLQQPVNPPTTFGVLEERTYLLNISTSGPPVVDASYTFKFPSEEPVLRVTGRRVVVWPWMPQTLHNENLEWKTDLLPTFSNEQRLALRAAPRQDFSYTFQLDNAQFSKAKAIATQWSQRVYGIPVWSELTRLGPLSQGASILYFDTTNADYRSNDIIIVWESDTKFVAVETLGVLPGQITLKLPLETSYSNAYVAPMRFVRTYNGVNFKRSPSDVIVATSTFSVTQNTDLGSAVGYTQYRSRDVVLEPLMALSDMSEKISRSMDLFDNGSGPILIDVTSGYVRSSKSIVFDTLDRASRWTARKWIHSRRGKQKSFWIPSWNRDLIMLEDVGSAATSITVRPIGYPLYYGVTDIMIEKSNGTRIFARVLSSSVDANGNELLNLSAQVGQAINVVDVAFISFMSLVRFDSDSIRLQHSYSGRTTTTIPVVEVPE